VNTGFPGIANVATDGTFIYAASYQTSSGVVNKYDTSGALVGTINVGSGFGRDGFEVQNNPNLNGGALTFISNRGDLTSPYDVYKADGTLLQSAFIDPSKNGFGTAQTGIALRRQSLLRFGYLWQQTVRVRWHGQLHSGD
jgi:hypothetical protein